MVRQQINFFLNNGTQWVASTKWTEIRFHSYYKCCSSRLNVRLPSVCSQFANYIPSAVIHALADDTKIEEMVMTM